MNPTITGKSQGGLVRAVCCVNSCPLRYSPCFGWPLYRLVTMRHSRAYVESNGTGLASPAALENAAATRGTDRGWADWCGDWGRYGADPHYHVFAVPLPGMVVLACGVYEDDGQ